MQFVMLRPVIPFSALSLSLQEDLEAKAPAWGAKPVTDTLVEVEGEELPALGPSLAKAAATAPKKVHS